jgi:hypothetical protein
MKAFWSVQAMHEAMEKNNAHSATILAIGDSWFWYPFPGGSLLNNIADSMAHNNSSILAIGNNGAEARDFVEGKYKRQVETMLRLYGSTAESVWISGGGNDVAGWDDFHPMLKTDCSTATKAADCLRLDLFDFKMNDVLDAYTRLIKLIQRRTPEGCSIFVHTYDYAYPDGRTVLGSAWIKPALVASKVPQHLHHEVVKYWIDQFASVLKQVQMLYVFIWWTAEAICYITNGLMSYIRQLSAFKNSLFKSGNLD